MKKYLTLQNLGWLLTFAVVFLLGSAGINKLVETEQMVNNFNFMHLSNYLIVVGLLEVMSVVLLTIPRTSKYGVILITSIMSGAITLHMSLMEGNGVLVPVSILLISWGAYCLRTYGK